MDFSSIMGMLGGMMGGGDKGAAPAVSAPSGFQQAVTGLKAGADYWGQQGAQNPSLLQQQKQQQAFANQPALRRLADYTPMDTTAPNISGITSMRY